MFKKALKIFAIVIGVLVVLIAGFYTKVYISTEARINKHYDIKPVSMTITQDSSQLALGKRLITAKGCQDCHGADLGGKVFIEDPALGLVVARNLTKGKGGLPQDHSTEDWVLALKHGIRRDGKPLLIMPAHEYTLLTEEDMKAIISYSSQLAPIDRELPGSSIGFLGRILSDLGKIDLLPAEKIDHTRSLRKSITPEVSVEFGKYLSVFCQGCHRENMQGGDPIAPGFPPVANISSSGHIGQWTEEQFMNTLRSGKTPEGKELNPKDMPWPMTKAYTDVELKALFKYLNTI